MIKMSQLWLITSMLIVIKMMQPMSRHTPNYNITMSARSAMVEIQVEIILFVAWHVTSAS